jgi:hypothetical protein
MSSKRPAIDLSALTSEQATPMPEAVQRTHPALVPRPDRHEQSRSSRSKPSAVSPFPHVGTANLEALAFKVSPQFRKRFRERAVAADLKLNELLFEAFDAWEEKHGLKK